MYCTGAGRVLIAAFVNFSAVCGVLHGEDPVHLLCAGTHNEITREDVLLAGAIADELLGAANHGMEVNDQAEIAAEAWRSAAADLATGSKLSSVLSRGRGARNLIQIGNQRDIEIASEIDKFDIVPELDRRQWSIRVP